jgi:hypothetical protein
MYIYIYICIYLHIIYIHITYIYIYNVVQHGACLGVGLAAMATGDEGLFDSLRTILFTDSAVAGEGAALAIGK